MRSPIIPRAALPEQVHARQIRCFYQLLIEGSKCRIFSHGQLQIRSIISSKMTGFGYLINPAGIFGAVQNISLNIKLGVAGIRLSARLDIFFNIHLPPGLFSYLIELPENFLIGGFSSIINYRY
jgi:hypothetical protein